MTVTHETDFQRFEPWSGAVDTWNRVDSEDKLSELEQILEDVYGESMSDTELNDILWFDSETIYTWLDMKTDQELAEEERERERRLGYLDDLLATDDPHEFCVLWASELEYDCGSCPLYQAENCETASALTEFRPQIEEAVKLRRKEEKENEL